MSVKVNKRTATIANGTTDSDIIDLEGQTLCGLTMPSALTGTAITFSVEGAGNVFSVMADGAGADVSKTVAVDKYIKLSPTDFAGVGRLKLISGSSEGAERSIIVHLREIE